MYLLGLDIGSSSIKTALVDSQSGDTLAVGAYSEASDATGVGGNQADNNAPYSGAVYIY